MISKGVRILTVENETIADPIEFTKNLLSAELWEMVDVKGHLNRIMCDRWGAINLIATSREAAIHIVKSFVNETRGKKVSKAVLLLAQIEGSGSQGPSRKAPIYQPHTISDSDEDAQ